MDLTAPTSQDDASQDACGFSRRLGALHDDELPSGAARAVRTHLAACGACQRQWMEIEQLSLLARQVASEGMSLAAMQRILGAIDEEPAGAYSILRLAGVLSALAASALVVGGVWLSELSDPPPAVRPVVIRHDAADWEKVASSFDVGGRLPLGSDAAAGDRQAVADGRLVDWMLKSLDRSASKESPTR